MKRRGQCKLQSQESEKETEASRTHNQVKGRYSCAAVKQVLKGNVDNMYT